MKQSIPKAPALDARESAICKRLAEARYLRRLTQSELADLAQIRRERLASYEQARAPLRYDVALRLCQALDINQRWLATGNGVYCPAVPIRLGNRGSLLKYKALFSEVYDEVLAVEIERAQTKLNVTQSLSESPEQAVWILTTLLSNYLRYIPRMFWKDFCDAIGLQAMGQFHAIMRMAEKEKDPARWICHNPDIQISPDADKKNVLTVTSENSKSEGVKTEMQKLLDTVRRLTQATGKKKALAKFLRVPQPRISEWLSGKYEPGGQNTLKLINWVQQQER
jgi:transcriptional regulator with XRE-family HTH domain